MKYEFLAIFPNAFSDEEVSIEHKKLLDLITNHQGTVLKDEIVGRKRFAYQVRTDRSGVYTYIQFEAEPSSLTTLNQAVKLNTKTRRFSITKYVESSQRAMPQYTQAPQPKQELAKEEPKELKPEDIERLDTKIEELLNEEIK